MNLPLTELSSLAVSPESAISIFTAPARSFAEHKSSISKIRVTLPILIDSLPLTSTERSAVFALRAT